MDEPILANYRWTVDETLAADAAIWKSSVSRPTRALLRVCLPFLATVFGISALFLLGGSLIPGVNPEQARTFAMMKPSQKRGMLVGMSIALIFSDMYFFRRKVRRFRFARHLKKTESLDAFIQFSASEGEITLKNPREELRAAWDVVSRVDQTQSGFLIYRYVPQALWIPSKAFHEEDGPARFAELAGRKAKRFRVLDRSMAPGGKPEAGSDDLSLS